MTDDCDIDGDYRRTIEKLKQELAKVREDCALWRENWSELLPDRAISEFDSIGEKP